MWSSTLTKVCKIMSRKLEAQLKHAFPSLGLGRIWEKSGKAFCWGATSTDALLALRALSKLYPDMWPACELHETSWDWIIWDWIRLNHTEGKTTVVDGCSLFKILTPFDSATFRDWSHGMLPQLCLSNLEEMNGFSIGVYAQYHVATFGSFLRGIWQNSDRPFCNGGARDGEPLCQMASN